VGNIETAARTLAHSLLTGPWCIQALAERAALALYGGPPDPATLAARLIRCLGDHHAPHPRTLRHALLEDPPLAAVWRAQAGRAIALRRLLGSPVMEPQPAGLEVPVPAIPTSGDLARWLGLTLGELDWLADPWGRQQRVREEALRHYRYQWRARDDRPPRLIEMPKPRLKALQRRLLREILAGLPPHPAVHGFRRGRSCLSFATPHVGQAVVLHLDLEDFFQSVPRRRVTALYRTLGYPLEVARTLAGLCTHQVSDDLLGRHAHELSWEQRRRLAAPHLPQGAPTSPALSNLSAYGLDCRLAGLARHLGLAYTRYADDLAFSGPKGLARHFRRLHVLVAHIALEEGFNLNTHKTRLMCAGQRQCLTGIVINRLPNPARDDYDRLKATLHNCIRHGAASQNRQGVADFRAHLLGRVAQVTQLNPARGARLRALWERVEWNEEA
jgi:RNA-directed DNA polymerase